MKLRIRNDACVMLLYILSGLMIFGQLFGVATVTSLAFALSFVVVALLWVLHLKSATMLDVLAIGIIVLSFVGVMATSTGFSVSYFQNWLMFLSVFLYFSVCLKLRPSQQTVKKLFRINFAVSIGFVLAYVLRYGSAFYVTNTGVRYLTFDFYNPNVLAIFLFSIAITGVLYYAYYPVKLRLVVKLAYVLIFAFLISQTRSRTLLLAFGLFLVISVIFRRRQYYTIPQSNVFYMVIAVFPLLFAILYMLVIEDLTPNAFFALFVSEGKGLDSRQQIWKIAFDLIRESPLLGAYGYSHTFSQMHNSHVHVLASYGVPVFVLVVMFLFMVLKLVSARSRKTAGTLSAWAFIVCLVMGSGEAILFSGGLSFYLLAGQLLILSSAAGENVIEQR